MDVIDQYNIEMTNGSTRAHLIDYDNFPHIFYQILTKLPKIQKLNIMKTIRQHNKEKYYRIINELHESMIDQYNIEMMGKNSYNNPRVHLIDYDNFPHIVRKILKYLPLSLRLRVIIKINQRKRNIESFNKIMNELPKSVISATPLLFCWYSN